MEYSETNTQNASIFCLLFSEIKDLSFAIILDKACVKVGFSFLIVRTLDKT